MVHFLLPTFVRHSETYSLSVAMQIAENTILLFLAKNYSKTSIFGFFKNFNALTVPIFFDEISAINYLYIQIRNPFIQ